MGEEYWTTVGYDGLLRDGRTEADFLTVPDGNSGYVRNGWVGFWCGIPLFSMPLYHRVLVHHYSSPCEMPIFRLFSVFSFSGVLSHSIKTLFYPGKFEL